MSKYEPSGIYLHCFKGEVFAALGGIMMKHIRSCQLCGEDESLMYPLELCDGNELILCQSCLNKYGIAQAMQKIIRKYFVVPD